MIYTVIASDVPYVENFHLAKEYLQAVSESGEHIIVYSSEYKVGDVVNSSDVALEERLEDPAYGVFEFYGNIHLPILRNLKHFLPWLKTEINSDAYKKFGRIEFNLNSFNEILHTWMYNPNERMSFLRKDGGTSENFAPIPYEEFTLELNKLISCGDYDFIYDDGFKFQPEMLNYIMFALLESLVGEFFPIIRKEIYAFHKLGEKRAIIMLNNSQELIAELQNIFDANVPETGIGTTKGTEFLRAIMGCLYHLVNDGDSPSNYMARETSFWSFLNCFSVVVSKNNLPLFLTMIDPRHICIENDFDAVLLHGMMQFAKAYINTEEGKEENLANFKEMVDPYEYENWIDRDSFIQML